jgi:hypothetical protein
MRCFTVAFGFAALCGVAVACATAQDELDETQDASSGGSGGFGAFSSGGSVASGGTGGFTPSGGTGGTGGSGGSLSDASTGGGASDAAPDAPVDSGSASGFGPCVTHAEIANQSGPFMIGFCINPFACFLCPDDAVKPGDVVCSPKCLCVPLPPLCVDDAGADSGDAATGDAASDAAADAPKDAPLG